MRDLHIGDSGLDVKRLQASLIRLGQRIAVDGDYGPLTGAAVRAVKLAHRWPESPVSTGATTAFQGYAAKWAAAAPAPKPTPKPAPVVDKAAAFRAAIVRGYQSIMGAKEGGSVQKAIAAFCGLFAREPWCAETLWYVLAKLCGYNGPRPANIAYVPSWELFAKAHNLIVSFLHAKPGMVISFVWSGPHGIGRGQHIGVILKTGILSHTVVFSPITGEGNASGAGGDAVRTEKRYFWQINTIFDIAALQH